MARPEELLAQLRDIHLPLAEGAQAAPMQTGAAAALLVGILALLLGWAWRRWQQRPQNIALRRLRALQRQHALDGDAAALAQGIATLLRQQALRRYPATQVAGLVDTAWLAFLDAHGGGAGFRHGAGAALAHLPYQPAATLSADEASALAALAQHWLRANPL